MTRVLVIEDEEPVRVFGQLDSNRFVLTIMDNGQGMTAGQIADVGAYMQFECKLHEQQGWGLGSPSPNAWPNCMTEN